MISPFRNLMIAPGRGGGIWYDWMKLPYFALPSAGVSLMIGKEVTIYGDALVNVPIVNNLSVTYTCDIGTQSGNNLTISPVAGNIGDHSLLMRFYNGNVLFETKTITLSILPKMDYWGRKILMIGDSTIDGDIELIGPALETALPNVEMTYLGTKGTTRKHEAYPGYSINTFVNGVGGTSPFRKAGVLDIPAYFTDNSIDTPDIIYIRLGVNDINYWTNYDRHMTDSDINILLGYYDTFIDAFLAFNSGLNIIIGLPTDATSNPAIWGYDPDVYLQNHYIENIHRFNVALINRYANKIYNARVDCSYDYIAIDRINGYANGLHQNGIGDAQAGVGLSFYINKNIYSIVEKNKVEWYDHSGMVLDGSNNVTSWNGKFGLHPLTSAATKYPIGDADGALFDGSNDFMKSGAFIYNQPAMVYMLMKQITWSNLDYFFSGYNTAAGVQQITATPSIRAYAGTGSAASGDLAANTWGIIRVLLNGASSKLIVDANAAITGNFGTTAMNGITLGSVQGLDKYSNIKISETIFKLAADSTKDEADIYDHLDRLKATLTP